MEPDKWDVFLEEYQSLKETLSKYESAVDYAVGKFSKHDQSEYIEDIDDILGIKAEDE